MKHAVDTTDEGARLAELESFEILDTIEEQEYDDITKFASTLCDTPIALISLIDEKRQWFKSHHGLDARESPRDVSFCGHAIHQNDIFEIQNSLTHPDFKDNPFAVGEPHVVFYAGQPLTTDCGHNMGTLCVIDHKPKELTALQREGLQVLAKQVTKHLSLRKNNRLLLESSQDLLRSNRAVKDSQAALVEQTKLATMGQISSGIAHEINNPLSIIALTNQQIRQSVNSEEVHEKCRTVDETCHRISETIENLLALSQQSSSAEKSSHNLHELVSESIKYFRQGNSCNSLMISNEVVANHEVECVAISIVQVVYNLICNAADAIRELSSQWITVTSSMGENGVTLSIIDSGNGLSDEQATRIFEPFYSTKGNKGHGLGLSICQNLLHQQKGTLSIDTGAKNTQFNLWLPAY